jgi:hypothetical protein
MGGKFSRNKGQRGEREIIKLIQPIVDRICGEVGVETCLLERNLLQAHKGGADVFGLDWLSLEVKFQEKENVEQWWGQCVKQAKKGQEPILFFRKTYAREWKVKMFGYLLVEEGAKIRCPVVISERAALVYLESRIRKELQGLVAGKKEVE